MFSRRPPVVVSPRARVDYEDIVLNGLLTRGEDRALAYDARIRNALRDLGTFPKLDRARDEIGPGCRSHPIGQHVIFYRIKGPDLLILRILHVRMNATGRVDASETS